MDLIDQFAQFPQKTNQIKSQTQNQVLYERFKILTNNNNQNSVLALRLPNYIYNTYNIPYCIWHVPVLQPTQQNEQTNKKRQKNRQEILKKQLVATRQKYGIDIQISNSLDNTLFQVDVLLQTDCFDKVYIFCFISQFDQLRCLYQDVKKVEKIICYQTADNEEIVMFGDLKVKYKEDKKIVMASNLTYCFSEYIQTPNFFLFRNQFEQQNLVKMSLYAMLKQTNIQCRKMLIQQIQPVIYKICPEAEHQSVDNFFNFYQQSGYQRMPTQRILSQYSSQSFFHRFVNRFLRGIVDPIELYYLQPIFQDLYQAIHDLYQQQQANNLLQNLSTSYKKFVCYRGTSFKQKQIQYLQNSIGSCIETLGFLSTSISRERAMTFAVNTLLVIRVNDTQKYCQNDHGFAFIKQYSQFKNEQEILFNPLNSYTVDSVTKGKLNIIELTYGKISELFKIKKQENKKELSKDEQIMYILALEQQERLQKIKNQGSVLLLSGRQMEGSLQFWGKKYKISSSKQSKADSAKNFAQAYKIFGHHDKAVELLLESKNIEKQINNQIQYADTIDKLLQLKFIAKNKPFIQINEMRNEVLMIRQQKYLENNGLLNWANSLRSSAVFLYHSERFQVAIEDLNLGMQLIQQACINLYEKGKLTTRSANFLVTRALCYKKLKKISNAKQDLQQASRIIKTLYGQDNPFYRLIEQQMVLLHPNQYQKQLEYVKKANVKPEKKKGFEYKICQPFSEMLQKLQNQMFKLNQLNAGILQKQMKTLNLLKQKIQQVNKREKKEVEPSPHLNNQQNIAQNGFQAIMQMMRNITEASRKEEQQYRRQLQKLQQK